MPSVPREKYPEMNWRAADKVAAWKVFKRRMEVIFVADQIPEERQWALILVAGGDEAYNCWDTLEDTVQDRKKVDQVWLAFEKSFEQSTSFWHFRDTYLGDFRQDESETTADLDLRIKQTVKGCQWQKESEEERMIDLLYHATIYYEIRKFVQESDRNALTYEMVIEKAKAHERNVLEYKDHQESHNRHPVTLNLPVRSLYQRPPLASLLCPCPVPHLAAHAQRAPVQVAPIVLRLRHHPRAAHSRLRMLQAQRQAVQPVHHGLHHPNLLRWSALSTACLRAQEIVKAIQ